MSISDNLDTTGMVRPLFFPSYILPFNIISLGICSLFFAIGRSPFPHYSSDFPCRSCEIRWELNHGPWDWVEQWWAGVSTIDDYSDQWRQQSTGRGSLTILSRFSCGSFFRSDKSLVFVLPPIYHQSSPHILSYPPPFLSYICSGTAQQKKQQCNGSDGNTVT